MRNCEYIGTPSMFQSRVSGVGSQRAITKDEMVGICNKYPEHCSDTMRLQVCHSDSPPGTCKPVDWKPDAVTTTRAVEPPAKTDWLGIVIRAGSIYGLIKNLSK